MVLQSFILALAQFYLPLPLVHIIFSSGTMFVFVWNYILYGTKISSEQVKGMVIGFIGIFFIINGRIIMKWIDPSSTMETTY